LEVFIVEMMVFFIEVWTDDEYISISEKTDVIMF